MGNIYNPFSRKFWTKENMFNQEKLEVAAKHWAEAKTNAAEAKVLAKEIKEEFVKAYNEAFPVNPLKYGRNKNVFIILAIFLGGVGIHKFYQGKMGMGILYMIFSFTGVPALLGLFEAIGAAMNRRVKG